MQKNLFFPLAKVADKFIKLAKIKGLKVLILSLYLC